MRLFILYPFSGGVRGLHRFLLTRSVVTVLSALSSLLPGSRFAEGDTVESPRDTRAPAVQADVLPSPTLVAMHGEDERARASELRGVASASEARAYAEPQRSARGEGRRIELAQLDAPVVDFPNDVMP